MKKNKNYVYAFGQHFKEMRIKKFPKYINIVEASGMSMKSIQRYERGEITPTILTIHKLAKVFNVTPTKLLDFDYDENKDYTPPQPPYYYESISIKKKFIGY